MPPRETQSPVIPCVAGHGVVVDETRIDGVRLVEVRHGPGQVIATHSHDVPKLVVVVAGGATERIGMALVEHRAFELVVRARLRPHDNQYHATGARSFVFELERLPRLDGALEPATALRLGRRLVAAARAARPERASLLRSAVNEVAAAMRPERATPAWLDAAREALFARVAEPPTLAELAATLGVHPVHLAQAFRRRWDITPLGFVRAHRVFRAVELLARGQALSVVAAVTGFADQSHMTRAIRSTRQAPPGALQRAMRLARRP